jgi:hypothetical protein
MLKRVAWFLVGASGITKDCERRQVLTMAQKTPDIVGVCLDDFFHDKPGTAVVSLTLNQLRDIQPQIEARARKWTCMSRFTPTSWTSPQQSI